MQGGPPSAKKSGSVEKVFVVSDLVKQNKGFYCEALDTNGNLAKVFVDGEVDVRLRDKMRQGVTLLLTNVTAFSRGIARCHIVNTSSKVRQSHISAFIFSMCTLTLFITQSME